MTSSDSAACAVPAATPAQRAALTAALEYFAEEFPVVARITAVPEATLARAHAADLTALLEDDSVRQRLRYFLFAEGMIAEAMGRVMDQAVHALDELAHR